MDPVSIILGVYFGVPLGIGLLNLALEAQKRRRMKRLLTFWQDAAREAGLSSIEEFSESVTAYSGGLLVRLTDSGNGTHLEIAGRGLAPGLTLLPEPWSLSPREIEVGDAEFDREVSVQGPPAVALAVLDAPARHAVRALVRGPFQVRGHRPLQVTGWLDEGVLRVTVPKRTAWPGRRRESEDLRQTESASHDGEHKLPTALQAALALATRLVTPRDLAGRLASNLSSERTKGVRRRTLQTLLQEFPDAVATLVALRAACEDEDEELRLRAGIALAADGGRDVLLGLAGGEAVGDATSAQAVAALFGSLTLAEVSELLRNALRTRRLATAKECLTVLGRRGRDAVPSLTKVLLVERGELGEAAAEALGATADASAEEPLLRALAEGPPALRRASIWALGQVGTRDAVAPLREVEAADASLRGAARQAVAQVHARLAGAAQGQLSLAGGEAGRLSIAEDESGRLSLSDKS